MIDTMEITSSINTHTCVDTDVVEKPALFLHACQTTPLDARGNNLLACLLLCGTFPWLVVNLLVITVNSYSLLNKEERKRVGEELYIPFLFKIRSQEPRNSNVGTWANTTVSDHTLLLNEIYFRTQSSLDNQFKNGLVLHGIQSSMVSVLTCNLTHTLLEQILQQGNPLGEKVPSAL